MSGRYNVYRGHRSYGRPNEYRERVDRGDQRYDSGGYYERNRGGMRRQGDYDRHPKYRRGGRGGGGPYPGEKRRFDDSRKYSPSSKRKSSSTRDSSPKKEKEEVVVEEIPDDEVEVPDSLMDAVETLRMRKEVERNAADEDMEKLIVFCFTGKGYQCKTCGLLLTKKTAFASHLTGKSHVMNVIEARTAKAYNEIRDLLDIDLSPDDWFEKNEKARAIIMKQSKAHMRIEREKKRMEEVNYNKMPANFFGFNMELRKSIRKKEDKVLITSVVESTMEVNDFVGERYFGCEFVRPVTGFHCRLCSLNIRDPQAVLPHVDSRQHRDNYATYVRKNPDYEKTQTKDNVDVLALMGEHDPNSLVLAESDHIDDNTFFLSSVTHEFVRIPEVMNPELKREQERQKEKEEREAEKEREKEKEKKKKESEDEEKDADEEKDDEEKEDEEKDGDEEKEGKDEEEKMEEDAEGEKDESETEKSEAEKDKEEVQDSDGKDKDEESKSDEVNEEEATEAEAGKEEAEASKGEADSSKGEADKEEEEAMEVPDDTPDEK